MYPPKPPSDGPDKPNPGPSEPNPNKEDESDVDFKKLIKLVEEIQKPTGSSGTISSSNAAAATNDEIATAEGVSAGKNTPGNSHAYADRVSMDKNREVQMLLTDVKYIQQHIGDLKSSANKNKALVLLKHLKDATERRKATDFPAESNNLNKLLQIVAKLKLWVPPQREGNSQGSETVGKKEESPFASSYDNNIAKELFRLPCQQWGMDGLFKCYGELTDTQKNCLLCFSVFQCDVDKAKEDTGVLIKKRILIHWWAAEGFIDLHWREKLDLDSNQNPNQKTIEKIGEDILQTLTEKGFIECVPKKGQDSRSVLMHPFVHSFVTALAKRASFFDFNEVGKLTPEFEISQRACLVKSQGKSSSCKAWAKHTDDRNKLRRFVNVQTLFNVNESVIDIKPKWFSKMKKLSVLHLGRWRSDPMEHIEVQDPMFLEDLKFMKHLRLFSLQGLSTIMKLSSSVCELTNLIILDLKDCHSLQELPSGIGSLINLTHLDITNCHLLTKLPKGISLLSKLEVLKGFVIYDQEVKGCLIHDVLCCKRGEVCTLTDLVKLQKLRELSLIVNNHNFPDEEQIQVFRELRELYKLKISWEIDNEESNESSKKCGGCVPCMKLVGEKNGHVGGQHSSSSEFLGLWLSKKGVSKSLDQIKKLELWNFPKDDASSWLYPRQFKNLEKLYIKEGKLKQIVQPDRSKWKSVKTLRLKCLSQMEILWQDLLTVFPNMIYLEKFDCEKLHLFPCDQEGVWQKQ